MRISVQIELPGISCINCVRPIEQLLTESKADLKVKHFSIDVSAKRLHVDFNNPTDETIAALITAIEDCGIECKISSERQTQLPASLATKIWRALTSHWTLAALGLVSGIGFFALALSPIVLSFPATVMLTIAGVCITALIGAPSFYQAWKKLQYTQTLTMDTLFSLSAAVVVTVSIAALFVPGLPMMLEAALLIFGFRHLGQGIEHSLIKKASGSDRYQDRLPEMVIKYTDNDTVEVPLNALQIGDIIELAPGAVIPADGMLVSPSGYILDSIQSGYTASKPIKQGALLLSGFTVAKHSHSLRLRVTEIPENSQLAKMDKSLINTQQEKAPVQRFSDSILQYFIPSIIGLAIISAFGVALFFPAAIAIKCAAAVLVSACPCTLGLIVPLGVKVGIKKSLAHGVAFKNAKALEIASTANCLVFDLNGCLTEDEPRVIEFKCYDSNLSDSDCHAITQLLEQGSSHAIAKTLAIYKENETPISSITLSSEAKDVSGGRCAKVCIHNSVHQISIGNRHCMAQLGLKIPKEDASKYPDEQRIYLATEQAVIGRYSIRVPLKKDAIPVVQTLRKLGYDIYMLSGADTPTVLAYAKELNIPKERVAPNRFPIGENTKSAFIKNLQAQGKIVAMVGDGGNDSLALAQSNFGIAMPSSASDTMTQNEAQALITHKNCLPILHCLTIAKQSMRNIKQNLLFNFMYNSGILCLSSGLLLGLGFAINPALGAGLMVLQTSLILLNVFRFSRQKARYSDLERAPEKLTPSALQKLGTSAGAQLSQPLIAISKKEPPKDGASVYNAMACDTKAHLSSPIEDTNKEHLSPAAF